MSELKKDETITLLDGGRVVVGELIGEGGQGRVYQAEMNGKDYALKWYTCKFRDAEAFKANLSRNVKAGPPDGKFLWPLGETEDRAGSFGYLMDLRPARFSDFKDILLNRVRFPSMRLAIESALNFVNGFRALHRKGLSYQDLNDGNFFIDVETGEVLICDNDNVTPGDMPNPGNVGGKPGYMAPEVVRGETYPDSLTDYHSLAVILFKLFCRHDPLMGRRYTDSVCITEARELELYGKNPIFVFDPGDDSNRPVKGVHPNPLKLWPVYPEFFQDAFIQSFSRGMKNRNVRLPENEWQKILVRLRGMLIACPVCGQELDLINRFTPGEPIACACGRSFSYPWRLAIGNRKLPLFPGNRLHACHTVDGSDDYTAVTGEVIMNKNNPSVWGIRNLSRDTWYISQGESEPKAIATGDVVPVAAELSIQFSGVAGKIIQ